MGDQATNFVGDCEAKDVDSVDDSLIHINKYEVRQLQSFPNDMKVLFFNFVHYQFFK